MLAVLPAEKEESIVFKNLRVFCPFDAFFQRRRLLNSKVKSRDDVPTRRLMCHFVTFMFAPVMGQICTNSNTKWWESVKVQCVSHFAPLLFWDKFVTHSESDDVRKQGSEKVQKKNVIFGTEIQHSKVEH